MITTEIFETDILIKGIITKNLITELKKFCEWDSKLRCWRTPKINKYLIDGLIIGDLDIEPRFDISVSCLDYLKSEFEIYDDAVMETIKTRAVAIGSHIFVGFGIGFVSMVYNEKSKKTELLVNEFENSINEFKNWYIKNLDDKIKTELESIGSPIGAILHQDLTTNTILYKVGRNWIDGNGGHIKNVISRLD